MTLIIFVENMQETKLKANSQHLQKNEYIRKNNRLFVKLPLFINVAAQIWPCELNGTRKRIKFVIN